MNTDPSRSARPQTSVQWLTDRFARLDVQVPEMDGLIEALNHGAARVGV